MPVVGGVSAGRGWATKLDLTLGVIRCARKAGEFPVVTVRDVIEDCRKAAKMYRQEWPRAVSPDSVAMIYERIAGSLERAHAQGAPDRDKIALDAARSIMGLSRSLSPVQHKARIQCIVLDALSAVTSTERCPPARATEEVVKRRFGSEHEKPCNNPQMLTCAFSECQEANECQRYPAVTPEQEREIEDQKYLNCPCGGWDCSAIPGGPLPGCPYVKDSPTLTPAGGTQFAALLALSSEPAQGAPWQPIETAPKDGTHFLAIYGVDNDDTYWVVFWNGKFFECVSGGYEVEHATHWMPLPAFTSTERKTDGS